MYVYVNKVEKHLVKHPARHAYLEDDLLPHPPENNWATLYCCPDSTDRLIMGTRSLKLSCTTRVLPSLYVSVIKRHKSTHRL